MHTPRKRLMNRNDGANLKAVVRRKGRGRTNSSGFFMRIALLVGCVWIIFIMGFVKRLKKNEQAAPMNPIRAAQKPLQAGAQLLDPRRMWPRNGRPVPGKNKVVVVEEEEEEESEVPETGAIHTPNLLPLSEDSDAYRSPLLIFTCRRKEYLSQTLDDILSNIGDNCAFGCPVVVSEDGAHESIRGVIEAYTKKFEKLRIPLIHMQHHRPQPPKQQLRKRNPTFAYQALAQHYGWALGKVFLGLDPSLPAPDRVIILEEDIHTSPDFFSYMKATSKLLDEDPTLMAVSAYNDNGHMVKDPTRILRSDFFPGLGWMMNRRLWIEELESKWPPGYWDDWLREPGQRKGRHILRPEVSRTYHFGEKGGTSRNQFGSILSSVKLNKDDIDWTTQDLSYLDEDTFDEQYGKLVAKSTLVRTVQEAQASVRIRDTRLEYGGIVQFKAMAKELGIMDDEKASVPRTAYKGVVEIRPSDDHFLFLTPPLNELKNSLPSAQG